MGVGCRFPWLTVVFIFVGFVVLGIVSWVLLEGLLPGFVWWGVPLGVCGVVGGLRASWEAVRLLGGVGPFFCGGRRVVAALLGRGPAPVPERVVDWGVYSVSRHPVYSASLGAYLLVSLVFPRLLLGALLVGLWVYAAMRVEEVFLRRAPGYEEYASRVPGLVPFRVVAYGCGLVRPRA